MASAGTVTCSRSAMRAYRLAVAIGSFVLATAAWGEDAQRGSTPPGQSRDGAAPSDGALKGGAILPGETGGTPDSQTQPANTDMRCFQLSGTLREECLRQGREGAAAGASQSSDTRRPKAQPAD